MAVVDVDLYQEEQDYYVVFHRIQSEGQKERIREWVDTLRGISTSFSEYMFINDMDKEEDETMTGTLSIIPEGKYSGLTIDDAYNMNGHYSLSDILLNAKSMKSVTQEEAEHLYREAVEYTIPLLKDQEISFEDFLAAYKPFLKRYTPGEGKPLEDWLLLPQKEQAVAYEEMISKMIERMYKSIEPVRKKIS